MEHLGPVVSESQAYPGLQKAVLVEPRRKTATDEFVERVREVELLEEEVIEVWDWNILENFAGLLDRRSETAGRLAPWPGGVANDLKKAVVETKHVQTFIAVIRKRIVIGEGQTKNVFQKASFGEKLNLAKSKAGEWLREL